MTNNSQFKNATLLVYGAALSVIIANTIMWRYIPYEHMPVIPGFGYITGIAWALLFFWAGLIIRQACPNVKWWIQLPILALAMFCLYRYISYNGWTTTSVPTLYASLFCLGFIAPLDVLKSLKYYKGWCLLGGTIILAFCFVAISVASNRLYWWDAFKPQFADMQRLLRWLTAATEPLLLVMVAILAVSFSFTQVGQWLGGRKWVKWFVIIASVWFFLPNFIYSIGRIDSWYFSSRYLVQPINIYLLVGLYRKFAVRNERGEKLSWKEAFKVL